MGTPDYDKHNVQATAYNTALLIINREIQLARVKGEKVDCCVIPVEIAGDGSASMQEYMQHLHNVAPRAKRVMKQYIIGVSLVVVVMRYHPVEGAEPLLPIVRMAATVL